MSINFVVILGLVLILVLLGVLLFIPTEGRLTRKQKKQKMLEEQKQQDWEKKALRFEKAAQSLRQQVEDLQKSEKQLENSLVLERAKVKKFQEKLTQERQWQEREEEAGDKKGKELQRVKEELLKSQEQFAAEHGLTLRLQAELKTLKHDYDALLDDKRKLETENAQMDARMQNLRSDVAHLKKDLKEITKTNEDTQWVAKTEYDAILKKYKEKDKEVERMARDLKDMKAKNES